MILLWASPSTSGKAWRSRRWRPSRVDAPKFFKAIEAEPQLYRAYWQTMILVGPRGSELRRLLWCDVAGDTPHVPRHEEPRDARDPGAGGGRGAEQRPKDAQSSDLVFGFDRPKDSWVRVLKYSGQTGLRPHDVRPQCRLVARRGRADVEPGRRVAQSQHVEGVRAVGR